ncbi:type VII secretion target [Actinocrispum wychmicini]|uniref:Excreted virulence factor EspC (Type VII ESX diderm) n=1 Tax=Actinocrispum wychmicini TaxID=1213861 RepID=A0A4R2JL07_9PSEU|nr:type VII secretion target [Actinocrispum wychmicini]TCO57279.1 excreted virulence factor EspC (type VII ESX diderm) [Actinocrispum wychmicini]
MPEGFGVRPDELTTHAKAVSQVASTLDQAMSAAQQVTLGVQAYGMICGPLFVPIVLAVSAPGLITLGMAQRAMSSVSDGVTQTAAKYQAVDQTHAQNLSNVGGDLR